MALTNRSHFKIAQVAKTRAAKLANEDLSAEIDAAKRVNPIAYLESLNFRIVKEGVHSYTVKNGDVSIYNLGLKSSDGFYYFIRRNLKAGDKEGGDNISLVRELEPNISFKQAITRLTGLSFAPGSARLTPLLITEPKPHLLPVLKEGNMDDARDGKMYLKSRGITTEVINAIETQELITFRPGYVMFLGYDEKRTIQSITNRATFKANILKFDEENSHKEFTPIYFGNPSEVWIVEGGVSALAQLCRADRAKTPRPTILVSGGSGNRAFVDDSMRNQILKNAIKVIVAGEIESGETVTDRKNKQASNDAHREATRAKIESITTAKVTHWIPQFGLGNDLAEYNLREHNEAKIKAEAEAKSKKLGI